VNVAPETCRAKTKKNKLDLLHLVGIYSLEVCLFKNYVSYKLLCAYCNIDMHHQVGTELSHVDCVLVPVDVGFLLQVIRLGLWGISVHRFVVICLVFGS
jgi:hypothetical protein